MVIFSNFDCIFLRECPSKNIVLTKQFEGQFEWLFGKQKNKILLFFNI